MLFGKVTTQLYFISSIKQVRDNLMTHFLGKVPAVFKTKELSNVLDRQLKNLMTHFLGKVPVDLLKVKNIELGATWSIKYHSAALTTRDIFMKMA